MLRDTAMAIIRRGIGFRGDDQDQAIVDALNQAQAEREGGHSIPWFLLQEDQTIAMVADQGTYALDTGFIREDTEFNPTYVVNAAGDEYILSSIPYDEGKNLFLPDDEGTPVHFAIRNNTIVFFPPPLEATTFVWSFYKKDQNLDMNVENLWLEHVPYVLIADAGLKVATDLRDIEATAIYKAEKNKWDDWYVRQMSAKREFNTRYAVGRYA